MGITFIAIAASSLLFTGKSVLINPIDNYFGSSNAPGVFSENVADSFSTMLTAAPRTQLEDAIGEPISLGETMQSVECVVAVIGCDPIGQRQIRPVADIVVEIGYNMTKFETLVIISMKVEIKIRS